MAKGPKDEEWAWSGRESPFRKKLASLRDGTQSGQMQAARTRAAFQQPKKTAWAIDPSTYLPEEPQTLSGVSQIRPEELEEMALLDRETGFLNAKQFLKRLDYELKRGKRYKRPVAICLISVDGIKDVKSMYGQRASDSLVKLCADAVRSTVRDVDLPARYSEEELAVIFPETNAQGVRVPAERIRERIKSQVTQIGGEAVYITATIGVASFPAHAREVNELMTKAQLALEVGAQRGGDIVSSA